MEKKWLVKNGGREEEIIELKEKFTIPKAERMTVSSEDVQKVLSISTWIPVSRLNKDEIEAAVMAHEKTQAQLQGRTPKKVIIVPGKIINIVG